MNDLLRWWLGVRDLPQDLPQLRLVWEHPFPGWVWLLVIVLAIAISFWSYSRIDLSPRFRWIFASMRSLLIIVLAICVAGPMLELPQEEIEDDWVVVLLDRSRSLGTKDGGENLESGRSRESMLREIVDATDAVWTSPPESRRILWLGFGDGVRPIGLDEEGAPILEPPSDWSTRLAAALEESLRQTAGRPLAGVVVLSDGRTVDPPDRELLRRFTSAAAPIQTIPLGSRVPIGDAALERIEYPRRAFARDSVPVVVTIDPGGRRGAVEAQLVDLDDGRIIDTVEIDLEEGDEPTELVLNARPDDQPKDGVRRWAVRLVGERDLVPENDATEFTIELVDRPLRVLYIEGSPRWEYRYLKNLLVREPSIESSVMLLSADRDFAQEGNTPLSRLPRDSEEFGQFDLIILGDLPANFLNESRQDAIREQVASRGSGLIFIGGPRSMPENWDGTPLGDLLPFTGSLELTRRTGPVNVVPTEGAARLGILRLDDRDDGGWPEDLSDPSFGWSRIQWAQEIEVDRLKPTAEILAEAVPVESDGVGATPILIGMRFGAGQVLYMATDEIWRWRYGRGEQLYERFWVQLLRLLGREAVASDAPIRMVVTPERAVVGRPLMVSVDLLDTSVGIDPPESLMVEIERMDSDVRETIEIGRSNTRSWTGSWIPNRLGVVSFRIVEPGLAALAADLAPRVEVIRPDDEIRMADADHGVLESLATTTGGTTYESRDPRSLEKALSELPNRAIVTETPIRERIWTSPLVFLVVVLLVTLEWSGRRWQRLD